LDTGYKFFGNDDSTINLLDGDSLIPSAEISNNSDERNDNITPIFITRGDDDDEEDDDNNDENENDGNSAKIEEDRYKGIISSIEAINDASKFLTEYFANLIIYGDRCSGIRYV
jgi:hypothetical protein